VIAAQGARGDQILVQLPGVTDVEQAKRIIKTTAQLSLKLVETSAASQETLLAGTGGKVPDNQEVLSGPARRRASRSTTCCARRRSSPGAT
jgi:preprotein translocase subunit SecD